MCDVNEAPAAFPVDGRYLAASLTALLGLVLGMLLRGSTAWGTYPAHRLVLGLPVFPPVLYRRGRPTLALLQVFRL